MLDDLRHNCAVVVAHTLHDAYSFGESLQPRGREAAGLGAIANDRIDVVKWKGTIDRFSIKDLHRIFPGHDYHTYLFHARYATRGRKDEILEDAHPLTIGGRIEGKGDHVFVLDCEAAIIHNGQVNKGFFRDINASEMNTGCDSEYLLHFFRQYSEREILKNIPGAYTLAIADKERKDVVVLRDRTGMKPGVLGWKDGKVVMASEDVAFNENGATVIEELTPGSIYYLEPNGNYRKEQFIDSKLKFCFFEYNYIANVLSTLGGVSVRTVRSLMGEALANDPDISNIIEKIDVVTYMPRCPEPAAIRFAEEIGKPFEFVFYKPRDERAFQGPTLEERARSVRGNLFLIPEIKQKIKGKVVAVVDDSLVRGNNSTHARNLLYDEAQVKEAHLINYTPPIGIIGGDGNQRGCSFGVDMPPNDNFVARERTLDQIAEHIGMPVHYLSLKGMLGVFAKLGITKKNLCYFCIGGNEPFKLEI